MWLQISAGLAPIESCRFVYLFCNQLFQECLAQKIDVELVEAVNGAEKNTYKSVFLKLTGLGAREYSKANEGSMLWICKSEYRTNHKRNNWFIEVEIFDDEEQVNFITTDIKIETFRCSGNGGQNVNKLETGIRISHLPTGIVVIAQEERSQLQNKKLALIRLQKRLKELQLNQEKNLNHCRWAKHQTIKRGEPIRIFKGKDFKEITLKGKRYD